MDLGQVFTGGLSWRRLLVLLRGLPPGSRTAAASSPAAGWGPGEHLAAHTHDAVMLVADELAAFRWQWVSAQLSKGAKKPPRPKPYPRVTRPGHMPQTQAQQTAPARMPVARAAAAIAEARRGR